MDNREAIEFSIQILNNSKEALESTYLESVRVKQRIETEPNSFSWKWEDGGYWVLVYNESPAQIKKYEIGIQALEKQVEKKREWKETGIGEHQFCSVCKHRIMTITQKYCSNCGQRLEKEEVKEGK